MVFDVELPHVGESVTEAVIGKWLKALGDFVEKYDPLVEVVTDKVNMDVPCPASGTLTKILAAEGDVVPMGSVIAEMDVPESAESTVGAASSQAGTPSADRIGTLVRGANVGPTGGAFTDTSLSAAETNQASDAAGSSSAPGNRGFSPVVTRLAAQHNIDLTSLTGTGLGGRVTKKDVLVVVENGPAAVTPVIPVTPLPDGDQVIVPTPIRRMIADHMVKSMTEIPHAWSAIEIDVTRMVEWRTANKERFEREHGVRLTYLPITLLAVSAALNENPQINSSWIDGKVILKGSINVSVAVATDEGLVVPVVHDSLGDTVPELAWKLDGVVGRARTGKMTLADVQGGTFTLNNTGALGSVWGGAIINYPQAAILTTEAIVKRPVVVTDPASGEDSVVVRSMMNICLSFDHRVIDGAEAAVFLRAVKTGLESIDSNPDLK